MSTHRSFALLFSVCLTCLADPLMLYDGIELPAAWRARVEGFAKDPVNPPYLVNPPKVINIGRQLVVDDLI